MYLKVLLARYGTWSRPLLADGNFKVPNIRTPDCWPWKILARRRTLPDRAVPSLKCRHFSRFPFVPDSWLLSIWGFGFLIDPLSLIFIHSSTVFLPWGSPPRSNRKVSTLPDHWTGCLICINATIFPDTEKGLDPGWIWFDLVRPCFTGFSSLSLLQHPANWFSDADWPV